MYGILSTNVKIAEPTEAEAKQCAVIKFAEGNVYIYPQSLYARQRLYNIEALRKVKLSSRKE